MDCQVFRYLVHNITFETSTVMKTNIRQQNHEFVGIPTLKSTFHRIYAIYIFE